MDPSGRSERPWATMEFPPQLASPGALPPPRTPRLAPPAWVESPRGLPPPWTSPTGASGAQEAPVG
eukprot:8530575-Alexandrium_andersonii.AAC.1